MLIKKILVIGIIILFLGMSFNPSVAIDTVKKSSISISNGNTLYVGGTGPNNYTKIQDAIDNATDGDTVFVYAYSSPYYEHIIVNKSINLIGEDRETTVIDGRGSGNVIYISVDEVTISGFTIRNASSPTGIGIYVESNYNVITNNNIFMIFSTGIYSLGFHNNTISYNNISNNIHLGIYFIESNNNIIVNNEFLNNGEAGIALEYSCNNIIQDNNIAFDADYGIVIVFSCNNNIVMGNHISFTRDWGIYIACSDNNTISGNTITNTYFDGIKLLDSYKNTISRNIIADNYHGIFLFFSESNTIQKNNFHHNKKDTYIKNSRKNNWERNYWNRPRILPKLIIGTMNLENFTIPWFNFDWHPAREPYDI